MKKNIGVVPASFISFVLSITISMIYYSKKIFSLDDKYLEFIYGDTIFLNYSKSVDVNVVILFALLFFLSYFILSKIFIIDYFEEIEIKNKKYAFYLLIGIPFLMYFLNPIIKLSDLNYVYSFITYFYLIFIYFYKEEFEKLIRGINILLFGYLSSRAIQYVLNSYLDYNIRILLILLPILIISFSLYKRKGIHIAQLGMPLYLFRLLENSYNYQGNIVKVGDVSNLKILVVSLILLLTIHSIYEILSNKERILLSTILIILFLLTWVNIPSFYINDEYHFGEIYTAYDQIYKQGSQIYTDYIPVKGYSHIIIGFLNNLFYQGGYISIAKAQQISNYLTLGILVIFLNFYIKRELIIILVFFNLLTLSPNYILIMPILLFFYNQNKEWNNIIGYLFLNFTNFMYYQSFGIALAISSLPFFIYSIYKITKEKTKPNKKHIMLLLLFGVICIYNVKMIFSALKYLLLNSSSNMLYWGNSSGYTGDIKTFALNFYIKHLWVIICIIIVIFLLKKYEKIELKEKLLYLTILIYPLIIMSYLLGRHDGELFRTDRFSTYFLELICVFQLVKLDKIKKLKLIYVFILSLLIGLNLIQTNMQNIKHLKADKIVIHQVPLNMSFSSSNSDLKLGKGFITNERQDDLEKEFLLIKAVVGKEKESSFLIIDQYVTQSARYSIFDYKIPTISHSMLNVPSLKAQKMELDRLEKFDIPLIRISSGINRYMIFYKYLLQKDYIYTTYNSREYLINRNNFEKVKDNFSLEKKELPEYLYQQNFSMLPIKWGNEFKNTKENLERRKIILNNIGLNQLEIKNDKYKILNIKDPFIVYELENKISGNEVDFIKLQFRKKSKKLFKVQIFWTNKEGIFTENKSVVFDARNGNLIVPIGKNLNWLKSEDIGKIRIDFMDLQQGTEIEIGKIEFFEYNLKK